MADHALSDADYRRIAAFRTELRRFLRFSEDAAREVGLTAQQHQALLAIRGHAGAGPPSVGELAAALQLRHHSVVGLVDRLEEAGLVRRETDPGDNRRVLLRISPGGDAVLGKLTQAHLDEHARLREMLHREAPPSRPRSAG